MFGFLRLGGERQVPPDPTANCRLPGEKRQRVLSDRCFFAWQVRDSRQEVFRVE